MSIERVSRYYDGPLAQTQEKYTEQYVISVFRAFPKGKEIPYIEYLWKETDTISKVAHSFNIGAKYWWEIMDINPEISDAFNIAPGTMIRVPYGS